MNKENLNFYGCMKLLEACIKAERIHIDPNNQNNILIYRAVGNPPDKFPEGWYSENIHNTAKDLMEDIGGQKALLGVLKEENIEFKIRPIYLKGYDFLEKSDSALKKKNDYDMER